ncbi:DUF5683 domain-containing protein [Pedobacter sp. SYSU D00535]|uniref:DUF5683 domain-containing protein n=1 Tax=Pedobacter sp. SYSU D00535 TaxID=2810308 RepID=UPI001A96D945|nr:DUF5683 domain-containing protein [Pedobacter sp. SYSU D00535]
MNFRTTFLLLSFLLLAVSAFPQTDTSAVKRDSAAVRPTQPRTRSAATDTVSNLRRAETAERNPPVVKDSARLVLERLPRQAALSSAIIPGWGQIRNGRWWKVPFIYGGIVGLVLTAEWEQRHYKEILHEIQYYQENGGKFDPEGLFAGRTDISDQNLIPFKDYYRRNRDLSILGIAAVYAINIIDAYVDAKFFRFDVSDDLAIKIQPSLQPQLSHAYSAPVPAIKIKISL